MHGIDLGALEATAAGGVTDGEWSDRAWRPRCSLMTPWRGCGRRSRSPVNGGMVLVGRRHLRSNNSWMHNLEVLVKGKPRCTLHINPSDAIRLALVDRQSLPEAAASRTGAVVLQVEVTDAIMPGVVSLPHGWGHDVLLGTIKQVASAHPGTNSNILGPPTSC